ncbi:MAG: major facilitator superfamily domain-containing protein [Linnemannia gamsii]|nr:MAG: major facilitator superfamily domain-containing protein [Linnemannia gamsii]
MMPNYYHSLSLLLIGGRLGDLFGHRRIFMLGVIWFSVWAVFNGFAANPIMISLGRALQGMGAGFTVPSALALLTTTYPSGPERNKALAIFGGTGAIGSIIGFLLGGILGSTIGWRWMFYLTAIIGFSMAILGAFVIPTEKGVSKVEDRRIDFVGIGSFTLGIVAIIYYLSQGPSAGWKAASTLTPLIVGIALLLGFVVYENKIDYPIMPPHIWKSRLLNASCVNIIIVTANLNAMLFYSSLVLQDVLHYTALKTALAYIVHGVGIIILIAYMPRLIQAFRTKILILIGWLFLTAAGIVWAQIDVHTSYWAIPFPALILNLCGMAPNWLCCQVNSVADADDEDQGVVGAVYNVSLQLGAPVGVALSNIIANSRNSPTAVGIELLPGYHAAFYIEAVLGGVGLLVALFLVPNRDLAVVAAKPETTSPDDVDLEIVGHSVETKSDCNSEVFEKKSDYATLHKASSISLESANDKKTNILHQ